MIWFVPVILAIGGGLLIRARRRGSHSQSLTSEPVSGQWLAEARAREEHPW